VLHQMRAWAKYIWLFVIAAPFVVGFLLYQTSGLMNTGSISQNTAVAKVNGTEILWTSYNQAVQAKERNVQRGGRALTLDEERQVSNAVFEELVTSILLEQEYARRGITVSDDEIREFARYAPPPELMQSPELQTNGQFDMAKYQRLLSSPAMRQNGELYQLEQYYRNEIPKQKLFEQITVGTFVPDVELWRAWRDSHDSAQVTYAAWNNAPDSNDTKAASESEMHAYFTAHQDQYKRQGRALISVVEIPRVITGADSAAVREHLLKLRAEIVGGAKFEDVAKRESQDSASAADGGDLGKSGKGRFVAEFEKAARALNPGEVSGPVATPFGYHLIKLDSRKGDTISVHHILLHIQPTDSNAARIDRQADELSKLAANTDQPAKLDSAARKLGLTIFKITAVEGQPAMLSSGKPVPSASAWAFGGVKTGEISDLFDDDDGYFMARLDSLSPGGQQSFDAARDEVRFQVAAAHHLDRMMLQASAFATAAAAQGMEAAAASAKISLQKTPAPITRSSVVPGFGGQFTMAAGAAFGLPVGAVSAPIRDDAQITVLRVDHRVIADSAAWDKQKAQQRDQRLRQLRQARTDMFLQDLHDAAKIDDRRKQLQNIARRTTG
jgi:peptidyl-prolyl cis-trans isomerase D